MTSTLQSTSLTQASWEELYDFLDPTRPDKKGPGRDTEAEARCVEITHKLMCFFANRGCRDAEDLAEETLLRVAMKCGDVHGSGYDDRTGYFFAVAKHVFQEWLRDQAREPSTLAAGVEGVVAALEDSQSRARTEHQHRCLDRCIPLLTHRARQLIIAYYCDDQGAKIERRQKLADEFGKSLNALRIEVHRIVKALRRCVLQCTSPKKPRSIALMIGQ